MAKRFYSVQGCSTVSGWFDAGFFSKSEKTANDKAKEIAENGFPQESLLWGKRFAMRVIRKPHGFGPPNGQEI